MLNWAQQVLHSPKTVCEHCHSSMPNMLLHIHTTTLSLIHTPANSTRVPVAVGASAAHCGTAPVKCPPLVATLACRAAAGAAGVKAVSPRPAAATSLPSSTAPPLRAATLPPGPLRLLFVVAELVLAVDVLPCAKAGPPASGSVWCHCCHCCLSRRWCLLHSLTPAADHSSWKSTVTGTRGLERPVG